MRMSVGFLSLGALLLSQSVLLAEHVQLNAVISGLSAPVVLTHAGDGSGRLFIVEQAGVVRIFQNGALREVPFLDIRERVSSGGERGLLGLAFHPDFEDNGRFFVNYTRSSAGQLQTVIAEYGLSQNANQAATGETILLAFDQPFGNHNGGDLAFGPDGYLYIASGDGGSGGDPQGHGQNLNSLLGKILRIDVDGPQPLTIPGDNPFVGRPDARPEIWAFGLRNPWRISFDRSTGRLFAGDVGQGTWEEVDLVVGGGNYGWNIVEGPQCFTDPNCQLQFFESPVASYDHSEGFSITGGYVYRGPTASNLRGSYIFGDFVTGRIWSITEESPGVWTRRLLLASNLAISSFGEDEAGNLYVLDYRGTAYALQLGAPLKRLFPQIAVGGLLENVLLVTNRSAVRWDGRFQLRQGNNLPWTSPWALDGEDQSGNTEFLLDLAPGETRRVRLTSGASTAVGYLVIEGNAGSDAADLAVQLSYRVVRQGRLEDTTATGSAGPERSFQFPVESSAGVSTGLAWAAEGSNLPTRVTLRLLDQDGDEIDRAEIDYGGHLSSFFNTIFAGLPIEFLGSLVIESDQPIAITALRVEFSAGRLQFTALPVQ